MKTPMKVSIKAQRIVGTFSRMRSRMSVTFKCIFSRENHLWFFFFVFYFVFYLYIYTENIIFSCISWERSFFIFRPKNKIIFLEKRNIIFPDNTTRKVISQCDFFGKTIFSEHLKKISYFHVFFLRKMSITFKCIFSGEDHHWFFSICILFCFFIYTYIQKISYFHLFLEKDHLSFSV